MGLGLLVHFRPREVVRLQIYTDGSGGRTLRQTLSAQANPEVAEERNPDHQGGANEHD